MISFRRQLELVKEELLQSEGAREDLKIKAQQQETDLLHMQQRIDELMVGAKSFSQSRNSCLITFDRKAPQS